MEHCKDLSTGKPHEVDSIYNACFTPMAHKRGLVKTIC